MKNLTITNQKINKTFSIEQHDERMWIYDLPLLETGKFIAGDGSKVEFSQDFLEKSVDFNNAQMPNRVPYLILGHIDETAALMMDYVFGSVQNFEQRDGRLYAKRVLVYKDKEDQIASGKYQGVSVSVNMETGEINHVALVGRQAIPSANINNARILKFEEFKGGEMTEKVKEQEFKQVELSQDSKKLAVELEALRKKDEETQAKLAEYAEKTKSLELQAKQAKAESFVEKAIMEGLVLPSQREFALKIAESEMVNEFGEFLALNKKVEFNKENPFTEFTPTKEDKEEVYLSEEELKQITQRVIEKGGK